MTVTLFKGANVWDGSGAAPFSADVLIEGSRIQRIAPAPTAIRSGADQMIDATGLTLMPGLVEGHAHLSFGEAKRNTDLGDIPPEEHVLLTMRNAQTLLDAGFTSAYSAASAKLRLDVVIRNEIEAGRLKGPRIRAAGPEITITGGLGDEDREHAQRGGFGLVADGPEEIVKAVRRCIRAGVDNVKINISGDDFVDAKSCMTVMSEPEIAAAVESAHAFQRRVNCHARAAEAVKRAVRQGVDVIYHCDFADSETLDLLERRKEAVFVGPAIGLIYNTLYEARDYGISYQDACSMGIERVLESSCRTYEQMRKRGIRVVIGGDYGFAWVPQGSNARDIEHFVNLFGYSASEALQCATRIGAELMGMGNELGQIKEGYLADLLLVHGNPLNDVSLLRDRSKLVAIVKGGAFHKCTLPIVRLVENAA